MESGKSLCIKDFDWDDTILIQEYDRIMKATKKADKKSKRSSAKKHSDKEEDSVPWQLGDYCRAIYEMDGLLYEAIIEDIEYDVCTVEFIGYGDKAEVPLDSLKESKGKKARRKQLKKATGVEQNGSLQSDSEHSNVEKADESAGPAQSHYEPNGWTPHAPERAEYQYDPNTYRSHDYSYNDQSCQPYIAPTIKNNMTLENGQIPVPPMPSSVDPAMSAMLTAWYMAGYYTGLSHNQKLSQHSTCSNSHGVSNCCNSHGVSKDCAAQGLSNCCNPQGASNCCLNHRTVTNCCNHH